MGEAGHLKKRVSLIGLGNLLLRDEGIGIHAVRAMEARNLALCGLEIVDGGTAGLDLLPYIEGRDHVLFVDAVNFGKDPGYIGVLENEQIAAMFTWKDSQHHTGLADVLAAAQLLDASPRDICLIGIQPHIIETGVELSDLLQAKLSLLPALILAKLRDWGVGEG